MMDVGVKLRGVGHLDVCGGERMKGPHNKLPARDDDVLSLPAVGTKSKVGKNERA